MRKQDIVERIYEETGLPKKDIMIVINTFLEVMKEAFKKEERIELRGFGVFEVKKRKARVGRNPRTKEEVRIPARKVITFKPSKLIKVIKEEK